jgi:hypothetical protein
MILIYYEYNRDFDAQHYVNHGSLYCDVDDR